MNSIYPKPYKTYRAPRSQNILDIFENSFNIITQAREKKGYTKEDLAEITGLNVRTIQRIERMKLDLDNPDISLKALIKVMSALDLSIVLSK